MKGILIMLVLLIAGAVGYGMYDQHKKSEREAAVLASLDQLGAIRTRFADASKLAGGTARMTLSGPVGQMQAALRELNGLEATGCATGVKAATTAGMEFEVEAYVAFMRNSHEDISSWLFVEATKSYSEAAKLARSCREYPGL